MTTCARCGLEKVDLGYKGCSAGESVSSDLACRETELSNLRALLRSVTGKLEGAAELLQFDVDHGLPPTSGALGLIASVLEVLS